MIKTLVIKMHKLNQIAKHASKELPTGMNSTVYTQQVCDNIYEIILHQRIQMAYYQGLIDAGVTACGKIDDRQKGANE